MNIVFLTEFDLSKNSGASFIRITELSKAFSVATGKSVYITSLMMDNKKPLKKKIYKEIPIYLSGKPKKCNKTFIIKRYFLHNAKFKELKRIVNYFEKSNSQTVFVVYNYFSSYYDQVIFTRYLKKRGLKVIIEKNESAMGIAKIRTYPKGAIKILLFVVFKSIEIINGALIDSHLKNFDGFLTINEKYRNFIFKKVPDTPILTIPILYDQPINTKEYFTKNDVLTIGYFGTINFNRDKIDVILKALYILKYNYKVSELKLIIAGKASKHEETRLIQLINNYDLNKVVNYVGYLSNKDLNSQIERQNILLALRNNNLQGKFSFATKIAMYMHMGKIPIVSDVSDNAKYITNNVNGFVLSKTDSENLARLLYEISKMNIMALNKISIEAKLTAQKHFNYKTYIPALKIFLNAI